MNSPAPSVLDSNEHQQASEQFQTLLASLKAKYSDIPEVVEAVTLHELLPVLFDLSEALLKGKVRPGDRKSQQANYFMCASDYHVVSNALKKASA